MTQTRKKKPQNTAQWFSTICPLYPFGLNTSEGLSFAECCIRVSEMMRLECKLQCPLQMVLNY